MTNGTTTRTIKQSITNPCLLLVRFSFRTTGEIRRMNVSLSYSLQNGRVCTHMPLYKASALGENARAPDLDKIVVVVVVVVTRWGTLQGSLDLRVIVVEVFEIKLVHQLHVKAGVLEPRLSEVGFHSRL